ncbi:MAG: HD domain-containing protein [Kiritimatiellae bacterium]|nr:HD domain-containing protein [Kiritimatiellia bacterium]
MTAGDFDDGFLARLGALYDAYVDGYRDADRKLPPMMQLKREHTAFVVANAKAVVDGENFESHLARVSLAAAWLHDTGRYEQLKRYDTFRDSDSVDHAVFSHDIVRKKGWLDACDPSVRDAILNAVLWHNRRDLPPCGDPVTLSAAHVVRDADKLDIFRVLEHQVATTDWRSDCRAFWNLPTTAEPNPKVVEAILDGNPVDYQNIRSLADFVLIQVGWMVSGLHYDTTRKLAAERGHLAFRRDFLHQITDSPFVDRICDFAARSMNA